MVGIGSRFVVENPRLVHIRVLAYRHLCTMLLDTPHVLQLRKDPHVTVQADIAEGSISLAWNGFVPSGAYRRILDDALINVCLHKLRSWASDFRYMNAILRQDERWTAEHWFPRVAAAGLQRMAIVMSDDLFNRMAMERVMAEVTPQLPFAVAYFDDPEQARAWLQDRNVERL
jgi:hypothetical protein